LAVAYFFKFFWPTCTLISHLASASEGLTSQDPLLGPLFDNSWIHPL